MLNIDRGRPRRLATCLRPFVMVGVWLAMVALTTACFSAPRGAEAQPTMDDVVGFGCSMAIAGAAAAIAVFVIGGRTRWGVELALSVLLLGTIASLLLLYALWFNPTFARSRMDLWSFLRLQNGSR